MDDHEAATVVHVLLERRLQIGRPSLVGRVVVEHHRLVLGELRSEGAEACAGRRRRDDVDLEQSGLVELLLQHGRRRAPVAKRAQGRISKRGVADEQMRPLQTGDGVGKG